MIKKGIFIFCILFFLNSYIKAQDSLKVGSPAPDFVLKSLTGEEHTLSSYKGKNIIYLNFFATWCSSCKEELPQLITINKNYKDQKLLMFGIDVKEDEKKIRRFAEKWKLQYPVLLDKNAVLAKKYGLKGFPLSIVIDGNGIIQYIGSQPPDKFNEIFSKLKSTIIQGPSIKKKNEIN